MERIIFIMTLVLFTSFWGCSNRPPQQKVDLLERAVQTQSEEKANLKQSLEDVKTKLDRSEQASRRDITELGEKNAILQQSLEETRERLRCLEVVLDGSKIRAIEDFRKQAEADATHIHQKWVDAQQTYNGLAATVRDMNATVDKVKQIVDELKRDPYVAELQAKVSALVDRLEKLEGSVAFLLAAEAVSERQRLRNLEEAAGER